MINAEEVLVKFINKIKWLAIKVSKTRLIFLVNNFKNLFLSINKIQLLYKEGFSHLNYNRSISLILICNNQAFNMILLLDYNNILQYSEEVYHLIKIFCNPN